MSTPTAFWDKIAPKYAQQPIRNIHSYEHTLERTRSYLKQTDDVLELGCGTGSTAILLADGVARYTATDFSPAMIAEAAAKNAPVNLRFAVSDWKNLKLLDVDHDVVIALNLLHLIQDLPTFLRRVHTLIPPGGLFISKSTCAPTNFGPLWYHAIRLVLPVLKRFGKVPFVAFRSSHEHDAMIKAAGFEIIETDDGDAQPPNRYIVARKI